MNRWMCRSVNRSKSRWLYQWVNGWMTDWWMIISVSVWDREEYLFVCKWKYRPFSQKWRTDRYMNWGYNKRVSWNGMPLYVVLLRMLYTVCCGCIGGTSGSRMIGLFGWWIQCVWGIYVLNCRASTGQLWTGYRAGLWADWSVPGRTLGICAGLWGCLGRIVVDVNWILGVLVGT